MEILNTIDGSPVIETVPQLACPLLIIASIGLFLAMAAILAETIGIAIIGLILMVFSIICFVTGVADQETGRTPTRYEVILKDGYILDATKYEMVEQRGKIFVVQKREVGEPNLNE
ncbi:hypothetical protein [Paenibacillus dendritiformis]|uniref:hypothetical protein n=1 Tax=Paenibacillus dendritiformis TaxID=130049 RepID=UPI00387E105D